MFDWVAFDFVLLVSTDLVQFYSREFYFRFYSLESARFSWLVRFAWFLIAERRAQASARSAACPTPEIP
jgi:hypothetical protein